jgi:hypothetical protein
MNAVTTRFLLFYKFPEERHYKTDAVFYYWAISDGKEVWVTIDTTAIEPRAFGRETANGKRQLGN